MAWGAHEPSRIHAQDWGRQQRRGRPMASTQTSSARLGRSAQSLLHNAARSTGAACQIPRSIVKEIFNNEQAIERCPGRSDRARAIFEELRRTTECILL
eukprot:10924320-Karenia_brevis.AAC.1